VVFSDISFHLGSGWGTGKASLDEVGGEAVGVLG
jgi:hypothetical protein